jgi:phage-related protein
MKLRRAAGFELNAVQSGLEPREWKPMQAIGAGVKEIRIHVLGEWRVMYVAKFSDAVYVLHAFKKKSQKNEPTGYRTGASKIQPYWRLTYEG